MDDLRLWSRQEIGRMKLDLERLFDNFVADMGLPCCIHTSVKPYREGFIVRTVLPGVDAEHLRVIVDERRVTVEAEAVMEHGPHRTRRGISRTVSLPLPVDPDRVEAGFENEILEIKLPKRSPQGPRVIIPRAGRIAP